uniref:Uncharacterized protein n=1 Tax=Alexandrium catenella TaxID=2925 RepID=A0A7S1MPV6_ALECA
MQPGAGYPCGSAGACAGMPGMSSWMYPSSYPVGMSMDPASAAAAAAQYGAAAAQFGAQYNAMAQYPAAAQYSAAAAAAAAQYGAAATQYGAAAGQYGVSSPAMQYMVAQYGGVQYPMLAAGSQTGAPQTAPAPAAA